MVRNTFESTDKTDYELFTDNKNYSSYEEFYQMLKSSLECMEKADDCGTVDGMMGMWQQRLAKWKPIFDEYGGI